MSLREYILASPAFSYGRVPAWAVFDAAWYRAAYAAVLAEDAAWNDREGAGGPAPDEALEAHWLDRGAAMGLSPNRFFDEAWYRSQNPDVREGIGYGIFPCGFLHYCESGFGNRAPHWLFSEKGYFRRNQDLAPRALAAEGFCNGYDHYLMQGDRALRQSHDFFAPAVFRDSSLPDGAGHDPAPGGFTQFLGASAPDGKRTPERRCSWYFDPQWYLSAYPEAAEAVNRGVYACALHHYLTNASPGAFDPNEWFSEAEYTRLYPDVAATVAAGGFRNGYEHFVRFGARERRMPRDGVDLRAFMTQPGAEQALRDARLPDPFALWVRTRCPDAQGGAQGGGVWAVEPPFATGAQYRALDLRRVETLVPAAIRASLDFRFTGKPGISVVLVAENRFHDVLSSLAALRTCFGAPSIEVVLADRGSTDETARIGHFAAGLTVLRPDVPGRDETALLTRALAAAQAPFVLLMEAGTAPLPGALDAALAAMNRSGSVWAVAGRSLAPDGRLAEAGTITWRDGSFLRYGEGREADEPEFRFVRPVCGATTGMLLCRRDRLIATEAVASGCVTQDARLLSICLALRESGGEVLFDPAVIARVPAGGSQGEGAQARDREWMRRRFSALLARRPLPGGDVFRARFADTAATPSPTALFLCDKPPYRALGGTCLRRNALLRALVRRGYRVTLAFTERALEDDVETLRHLPDTVEAVALTEAELECLFALRAGSFDLLWLAGASVLQRVAPLLAARAPAFSRARIVADLDGNSAAEAYLRRRVGQVDDRERFLSELDEAVSAGWMANVLSASHPIEAACLRALGYGASRALAVPGGVSLPAAPGAGDPPGFAARRGLLFALPVFANGDAAHDGLDWFVRDVLFRLDALLPPDVTLLIAGFRGEDVDLTPYTRFPRVEALPERADFEALYRTRRVLVDPSRVMSAPSGEIGEAAALGLPAVLTETTRRQLGWTDGRECLTGGSCDPARFADAVARLYLDEALWTAISARAREEALDPARQAAFARRFDVVLAEGPLAPDSGEALPPDRRAFFRPSRMEEARPRGPAPIRLRPLRPESGSPEPQTAEAREEPPTAAPFAPRLGISLPDVE